MQYWIVWRNTNHCSRRRQNLEFDIDREKVSGAGAWAGAGAAPGWFDRARCSVCQINNPITVVAAFPSLGRVQMQAMSGGDLLCVLSCIPCRPRLRNLIDPFCGTLLPRLSRHRLQLHILRFAIQRRETTFAPLICESPIHTM